ncbi:MAG: hypothetical protein V3V99_09890 [candidate division Zixibacteria bacterium]
MKKIVLSIIIYMFSVSTVSAQVLQRAPSLSDYWPEGKKKTYKFLVDSIEVGKLDATNTGMEDGLWKIEENLFLNFIKIGISDIRMTESKLYLHPDGTFNNIEMAITIDTVYETLIAHFDSIENKINMTINENVSYNYYSHVPGPVFSCDDNMFDQIEIILAMNDLNPAENIKVPIYTFKSRYYVDYEFDVIGKTAIRYGNFADSVWEVKMIYPADLTVFINERHELVRLEYPNRNLVFELERNVFEDSGTAAVFEDEGFFTNHIRRMPIYGAYLLCAFVWVLFLGREATRLKVAYIYFIAGGILYYFLMISLIPLQQEYSLKFLFPAIQADESIYVPALGSSIMVGIFHAIFKLILLMILVTLLNNKRINALHIGAFVGAGLGFVESSYITGPMFQAGVLPVATIVERAFTILFHTALGALLGYGIARRKTLLFWLYAVIIHSFVVYLIVFVQSNILEIKTLAIITVAYYILTAITVFYARRNYLRQIAGSKRKR